MKTIEYRTIDKSGWQDGEWKNEPDKIQWKDEATGLPCLIKRNRSMGILCGYVGVATDHPAYGKHFDEVGRNIEVHGGLTYSDVCHDETPASNICHIPEDGESDHVWWLGFDCGHAWDRCPAGKIAKLQDEFGDRVVYRNIEYAKQECASLAAQLVLMKD